MEKTSQNPANTAPSPNTNPGSTNWDMSAKSLDEYWRLRSSYRTEQSLMQAFFRRYPQHADIQGYKEWITNMQELDRQWKAQTRNPLARMNQMYQRYLSMNRQH